LSNDPLIIQKHTVKSLFVCIFSVVSLDFCKELPNKDHATCGKERFIGSTDCWAVSWVQNAAAQLEWVEGFIGGATLQGREGVPPREQPGCWPPFICDHQIEWVKVHSKLRSGKFLWLCKQGNNREFCKWS
jgi:hypothetical protein